MAALDTKQLAEACSGMTLTSGLVNELLCEAQAMLQKADRIEHSSTYTDVDACLHGRVRAFCSGPGFGLQAFQNSIGMRLARDVVSCDLANLLPTRASYILYEEGDYNLLHHDAAHANVTVLVGLSGDVSPLILYPSLGPLTEVELLELSRNRHVCRGPFEEQASRTLGARIQGHELSMPVGRAIAVPGRTIPHARFRQEACAVVAAACYALVEPSLDWQPPRL